MQQFIQGAKILLNVSWKPDDWLYTLENAAKKQDQIETWDRSLPRQIWECTD